MILGKLKEATRTQHNDLEKNIDIMNQMFSLEDYKILLCKFYRFYSAIEKKLVKLNLEKFGYYFEARQKTPKLEKDLAFLGVLEKAGKLENYQFLPVIDSPEKAFGTLYVLEGATLGGQIINRKLKESLGLSVENGASFFSGYGEQTGQMWKEFCQITGEFAESQNADEAIISSAQQTFESFKNCYLQPISFS